MRHHLDPDLAARIEQYRLVFPVASAADGGKQVSPQAGRGLDFHAHRSYAPGDDPRTIDWTVYARHRRLTVRLFQREVDLPIIIALDCSPSMTLVGTSKARFARQLAAAMAISAIAGGSRVAVAPFAADLLTSDPCRRGRSTLRQMLVRLENEGSQRSTDFRRSLIAIAQRYPGPALLIVISDLLGPGLDAGLSTIRDRRFRTLVFHLLDPEELAPQIGDGLVQLQDAESGRTQTVNIDRATLRAYRKDMTVWRAATRGKVLAQHARYVFTSTDVPLARFLLADLCEQGVLRSAR